jgi:hypothetical protein
LVCDVCGLLAIGLECTGALGTAMRGAMTGGLRAHGGEEAQHKCGNSKPRTGRYGARATEDLCSRFILNHRDSSLALMMTNKQTFSSAC